MSGRSSRRSALLLVVAAACSSKPSAPEADPAKVQALAVTMVDQMPPPGIRVCEPTEVIGGATLTTPTLLALAQQKIPADPEFREWVNPADLDSPAARTLIDPAAKPADKRRAAAELLAAPFYLVYRVDLVNAPMALAVKELKRGTVGARAIRYDRTGKVACARVFVWQNDKAKSEWAIQQSDRAQIDPEIAKALQDDLRAEMLKRVSALPLPPPTGPMPERIPDGISN